MTTTSQARPRPTPTPESRTTSARLGTVIVALLAVGAAVALVGYVFRSSDRQVDTFDTVTGIEIKSDSGAISLRATDAGEATVTTTREWSLGRRPDVTTSVQEGVLRVVSRCRRGVPFVSTCSAGHVVDVPAGVPVAAESSAGAIDADGLTAGLTAQSSAGAITVTDVAGDVDLQTSAGRIDATVASDRVRAVSSAGGVSIEDTMVPEVLTATTSAGAVDVAVPRSFYRVEADSSAGSVDVAVPTDPESSRLITARSSAGAVRVRQVVD